MSVFDFMLLHVELILVSAAAWCAIVLVPPLIKDIIEVMTNKHWRD